ncbi:MAG: efflux RND transporter permease subunit, partial [bacterium]|nr:efflux RND transporter permease subunit [bacterium]
VKTFGFALVLIYTPLAIPLRSYGQPLITIAVIPFGLVGAIAGHLLLGLRFSMMSVFGVVALSGVVVNSSLVLVHYINGRRAAGLEVVEAVREAGVARFRPIVLTSVTTFVGLSPLLLERSMGAQFLIPMAASLAFGVIFATGISLFVVPCSYVILQDLQQLRAGPRKGVGPRLSPVAVPPADEQRQAGSGS